MSLSPKGKCLLTGASGFIARRLAQELSVQGWEVAGLDVQGACLPPLSGFHRVDIRAPIPQEVMRQVGTVCHLAGKVHALSEVKQEDEDYFSVNTLGTENVLKAARAAGVRRLVFFSTVKAMSAERCLPGQGPPHGGDRPLAEPDFVMPDTPYGRSKLEAERLVLSGDFVPEPVVLRLCMVYGAGAKGNIQKMLQAVFHRRFPPLPDFGNRRSMVHVRDVVQAASLAAEKAEAVGEVFIVSDGKGYSTRRIYEAMCHGLGREPARITLPAWCLKGMASLGDGVGRLRGRRFVFDSDALRKLAGSAWFSSEKIEKRLGFRPVFDLEKAMPEMVAEMEEKIGDGR